VSPAARVRPLGPDDVVRCLAIVRGLPEFITPDVAETVRLDAERDRAWVVEDGDGVMGFAVVEGRSRDAAEILWAAVDAERRGAGLGTQLVESVLGTLREEGVRLVEVKTLDRSAGYPPYEATRAFWERRGFVHVDTIDPFPGWQAGNPAALYVAALAPTRGA
jgi:GNAT superfamily N-acetyltransferase